MYADVILNRRVPSKFDTFTYAVPESIGLSTGQLVSVPFRKQTLPAVVWRLHSGKPAYAVRPITEAFFQLLAPWQMDVVEWMSRTYECGISKVVDLFVPEKIWQLESQIPPQKSEKPVPQTLFLYPDLFSLKKFAKDRAVYHGELTEKKKAEIWQQVQHNEISEICGTRASLFLPFKNLKRIVLHAEENESYLEKRTPRYDALKVAERLAELWKIDLTLMTDAPRVTTWHKYYGISNVILSVAKYPQHCRISIIDMKDERKKGNFGIFGEKSIERIAATLASGKQVLLFVNRKGQATALFCMDCREVLRCSACSSPLTLHAEGLLHCHRCLLTQVFPETCPACRSLRLKPLGHGTERLESEIKKIFGQADVLRFDRETSKKGFDEKALEMPDILVATQIIDKPLSLPRLALTLIISADSLLFGPDFRTSERAWQLLTHLKNFTKDEFIIQTILPEHQLFQLFAQNKEKEFYREELEVRRSLRLPPFHKSATIDTKL